MANPQAACHRLLTALGGGGAPDGESARRVEAIIELLEQHSPDELLKVAEFLNATAKAENRPAAFDKAKAEVEKLPTKEREAVAAKLR